MIFNNGSFFFYKGGSIYDHLNKSVNRAASKIAFVETYAVFSCLCKYPYF